MTATTDRCPGCGECPEPERPESVAPRHPGATQSPDGSQGATEHVEITPDGNVQVMTTSWHEGSPYSCARPGCPAGCDRNDPTTEAPSDVRPSQPARDAVSDAEAAEWAALAATAAEGPWHVQGPSVEEDDWAVYGPTRYVRHGSAAWARGEGHPRLCSAPSGADANFIALARTAVPRLLADRERLVGANARMRQVAELRVGTWRDTAARLAGERDRVAATLEAEVARLVEEATVSAALLETEIAKRESAEMRANRATADLDALESEDQRQDVQAKHWREVLRIRRELDGIRQEMNDATEIIAKALGYRPSGLPLDGWPHLSTTGDHTPTSLAAEAAGVLAKASRLRAGIEALAAEMQSDTCPACHGSTTWGCDHTEGMQHAGDMLRALLAEGGE